MKDWTQLFTPNINAILSGGKKSILPKPPVQFGVPGNNQLPQPVLPSTANSTQQTRVQPALLAPAPNQTMMPAPKPTLAQIMQRGDTITAPKVNPLLNTSFTDAKKLGQGQAWMLAQQQSRKEANQAKLRERLGGLAPFLVGTGKPEAPTKQPGVIGVLESMGSVAREKGLPGLLTEGFGNLLNPTQEDANRRIFEFRDKLIEAGTDPALAMDKAIKNLANQSPNAPILSKFNVPTEDLTPDEKSALRLTNFTEKLFAGLDAPIFLGTTKPVKMGLTTLIKPAKYTPEMTEVVTKFADVANGVSKATPAEKIEIKGLAQELADAMVAKGIITKEAATSGDKTLANTLRQHMDESLAITQDAQRPAKQAEASRARGGVSDIKQPTATAQPEAVPTPRLDNQSVSSANLSTEAPLPVNQKLADFKAGRPSMQGGYVANPFANRVMPIDKLIAENKVRVVSRDGRDVYQVKKGGDWTSVRDEDSAIKQATPTPKVSTKRELPDALEQKMLEVDIAKEALANDPAAQLSRFVAKRGNSKGLLGEVTGRQNSKTGIGTDVRMADAGFDTTEEAREAYAKYADRKSQVKAMERSVKEEVRTFKATERLREKTVVPSKAVDQVRALRKVAPEQVRSLEETAQQINEVLNLPPNAMPRPLEVIIPQTPVQKKIHILDYFRTPDRVLNKIGFGKEAQLLRNQYEKYAIELPKNIDIVSAWVKRVPKDASPRIFDYLDGKPSKLSPAEKKVADEIKDYLKNWADRLGLKEEDRVTNYITRIFDEELLSKEFDEDLAKIISDKLPSEVYNPFLEKRLGAKGYIRDTWAALDAYTKRATRKVHLDPALEKIRDRAGSQLEFSRLEESQFRYINTYIHQVQMRPTHLDNLIDNTVKNVVGYRLGQRPVNRVSRILRQLTYRGMLGANLGSALRNLSQGINTYATLGEKYTVIGYAKLFNTNARKELAEQGVLAQNFIEDRTLSSTKQALQKADRAIWFFFDQAEKINRGAAYFGAKAKGINQGMTEEKAVKYAKSIVRKTQFQYDGVDAPVVLGSDLAKTLGQFQTFTTKQIEFLTEMAKDKNFVGLLRYGIAGYVFVNTVGKAMGMEEKELLPMYRFDTPPSLQFPVEVVKAVANTPDKYGNVPDIEKKLNNIGKSLLGLIPGGIQARKTVQGLETVEDGGSFDAAGRQQFEQTDTTPRNLQTILFGKYASPQAKEYFDKGSKTGDKELDVMIKESKEEKAQTNETTNKLFNEIKNLPKAQIKARLQELGASDPEMLDKVIDKLSAPELTSTEKAIKSLDNKARAVYIDKKLRAMPKAERRAYMANLIAQGVVTDATLEELERMTIEK